MKLERERDGFKAKLSISLKKVSSFLKEKKGGGERIKKEAELKHEN
jgi:hypothetical protein